MIYTAQEAEVYARMAHAAGANGFVNKGSSLAELVQAIEQVLDGETHFPAAALAKKRRRQTAGCSLLKSSKCWAC